MKTYMPLDGFRWSCDSDSALCDMRQTNVLGRADFTGGALLFLLYKAPYCRHTWYSEALRLQPLAACVD